MRPQAVESLNSRATPVSRGSIRSGMDIIAESMKSSVLTSELASRAGQLYDPFDGFFIYFDYLSRVFKHFEVARLVFSVHKISQTIFDPVLGASVQAITDPTDQVYNSFIFSRSSLLKGIQAHPSTNLIVEV